MSRRFGGQSCAATSRRLDSAARGSSPRRSWRTTMPHVRDKGEGTIYLRADSLRWTAAVTMHGKRATKPCPHKHRMNERRECAESRANLVELLRLRDVRAPAGGHRLTLGQYLRGWLDDVR